MIVIYHNTVGVCEVTSNGESILSDSKKNVSSVLFDIAQQFPNDFIAWCNNEFKAVLHPDLSTFLPHKKLMLSFNPDEQDYFGDEIGFAEHLPFIKINKNVKYPTWQMSSAAGVIHASVLIEALGKIHPDKDFDYFLNSVGKICMPLGLLCYSEPRLLQNLKTSTHKPSKFKLFRFVKQHYKISWTFLVFLNLWMYNREFAFLPFLTAFFYKRRNPGMHLEKINIQSHQDSGSPTIDVIIPTIGRRKYLYDVLCDLRVQTHLPHNVIIVEQNPMPESVSELDYLTLENWPFKVKHFFTHQPGACNARNIGLDNIESEWVFFADDDIRFQQDFIVKTFSVIDALKADAVSINCLNAKEKQSYHHVFQWGSFGSGCSFVNSVSLKKVRFNMAFEFGYGEDSDFGMQLRNSGCDILFIPSPTILHLQAPVGGFRFKPVVEWNNEDIKPKPSPTVMLYHLLHYSREEVSGYKTTLFFKFYTAQSIRNPYTYFINFKQQWDKSVFWANKLNRKNNSINQNGK